MARNARPTAAKREREKNLNVRRQDKAAKRQDVKQRKASEPAPLPGIDPDIADIVAGRVQRHREIDRPDLEQRSNLWHEPRRGDEERPDPESRRGSRGGHSGRGSRSQAA